MSAPRKLRDLPGFDDAMVLAVHGKTGDCEAYYDFTNVGDVVVPGLTRTPGAYFLEQLALTIAMDRIDRQRRHLLRPLRLVPPRRVAANDNEVANG